VSGASSLTLEHSEGDRWQVTIHRDDGTVTLDMNNAEAELLWVMLGESRGEGTFSRTVTFQSPPP
jgi:hypothetical protein